MSQKTEKKPLTHQIEINEKVWEKVSKFSKIIKWPIEKLIEYVLDTEMDDYCLIATDNNSPLSESMYHVFLEESFLKEVATIIEH